MKIRNIIDVITNSSSEIFTLKTNASLRDVSEYLKENTRGYREPERLVIGEGILKELLEWEYLYDPKDPESMNKYYLEHVLRDDETTEIRVAWKRHIYENRAVINKNYQKPRGKDAYYISEDIQRCYFGRDIGEYLPKGFIEDFLKSYKGTLPDNITLPDQLNVYFWMGGIGFRSKDENTIPYETWNDINEVFNGVNWHMG